VKIDNRLKSPVAGEAAGESRPASARATPVKDSDSSSVDVKLSPLAEQLKAIEGQLAGGEVFDARKVAEIKQAIAEGRFQINPDVIAERLLQTVQELLQRQRLQ
jgi:negative regulator of flagellin synthesis FlgM